MKPYPRPRIQMLCLFGAVIFLLIASTTQNAPATTPTTASAFTLKISSGLATQWRYHVARSSFRIYRSLSNVPARAATGGRALLHAARVSGPSFYPADVANPDQKPVVKIAVSHAIYVNCAASCWGDPENFLRNLGRSALIHVVDQYVNLSTPNRYTVGASESIKRTIYQDRIDPNEILDIVADASNKFGSGYGHIYHVFLPAGVDTCMNASSDCYSPDNLDTFQFCAYHVSADLPGGHHVLYTVEPFQVVKGCSISGSLDSSELENSTYSSLSHEMFETITDPDINAWIGQADAVSGQEIGDLCGGYVYPLHLSARNYSIQLEYSNAAHACVAQ